MFDLTISSLRFVPATQRERRTGLLGWLRFTVGDALLLDGITLRRTREGRFTLSFPGSKDCAGRIHHHVRPLNIKVRRHIEHQVLALLDQQVLA